jgi:accessory colonization factor AcfC
MRMIAARRKVFFTLFIAALISVSCGNNKKIKDMKEFINETIKCTEEFIIRISESSNESDIVFTIETFRSSITLLEEKSKAMKKKYSDLVPWLNEPPQELTDDLDRLHVAEKKLEDVLKSSKVRELRRNNKVQSAFIDLIKELERVKFFHEM